MKKRRYTAASAPFRCKFDIRLRDGSTAQCMRALRTPKGYCYQHHAICVARERDLREGV